MKRNSERKRHQIFPRVLPALEERMGEIVRGESLTRKVEILKTKKWKKVKGKVLLGHVSDSHISANDEKSVVGEGTSHTSNSR